jgi:PilZ domain
MLPTNTAPLTFAALTPNRRRSERRHARRLTPARQTPCLITAPDEAEPVAGRVHNLSLKGAGVVSAREFPTGSILPLLLVNAAHTFMAPVQFEVIRGFRVANGDYFLGGRFLEPLTYDDLVPFML